MSRPTDTERRANRPQGCHNCKRGCGDWCISCRRVDFDDIAIRSSPHDAHAEITAECRADPHAAIPCGEPPIPQSVTPFAPETEDALRALLSELAQLPPHVALLLHGLLNGKTIVEIGRMTGDTKQTAHARLKAAIRRFPWIGRFYKIGRRGGWTFAGYVASSADTRLDTLAKSAH